MKTKQEIIAEVEAKFTKLSDRAVDEKGNCEYLTPCGKNCAVGMFMLEPGNYDGGFQCLREKSGCEVEMPDLVLKPEYRGHSTVFWVNLQIWHDTASYFTKTGLSDEGAFELKNV